MQRYRPEIDGLRALAIVPVILFHAGYYRFSGGFLGVDIFFVISGFLICGIIQRELAAETFSIVSFYERRVRRILPALLLVIWACFPAAIAWMLPSEAARFSTSVLAAVTFSSNFYFWSTTNYFSPDAGELPLLHLWSLGVEEQFYIVFPLIMMFLLRGRQTALPWVLGCLFIVSLGLAEWLRRVDELANFYVLPTRSWELLAGALLTQWKIPACLAAGRGRFVAEGASIAGLLMIGGSILWLGHGFPAPSIYTLVPVAGTCLVLAFAGQQNICGRLLSLAPVRFVGLISYSAYLWHQPVLAFGHIHPLGITRSVAVALTFVLATLSWWFVERPFRHGGKHVLVAAGIGLAATAAAAGLLLLLVQFTPTNFPTFSRGQALAGSEVVAYADQEGTQFPCNDKPDDTTAPESCIVGARDRAIDVVLWGDSYAQALLPGMDQAAKRRGIAVRAFVTPGCPPVVGMSNQTKGTCTSEVHRKILAEIVNMPGRPVVILVGNLQAALAGYSSLRFDGNAVTAADVKAALDSAHLALANDQKRFVLMEQGPRFDQPVAKFYMRDRLARRSQELNVARSVYAEQLRTLDPVRSSFDQRIAMLDVFCGPVNCSARDPQGHLVMRDRDHVTRIWSAKIANIVLDKVLPAICQQPCAAPTNRARPSISSR